jgi:hypothetical protein
VANYVKSTNFASKDTLPLGDPLKIVKGTEIDTEFNNIATAVGTKADLISPTFTGTPAAPTASPGTNTTQLATTAYVTAALQAVYPVGSVYINASVTTNPATLLGFGTWVEIGAGRVLVGQDTGDTVFDVMGETGGSKDAIVVSHTHTFSATTSTNGSHAHNFIYTLANNNNLANVGSGAGTSPTTKTTDAAGDHTHTVSGTTASTGSSGTNANLQPYVVVKMWQRTA